MKIIFNYCHLLNNNDDWGDVKLGIGWFRHYKEAKWFGFDIVFYLLFWRVNVTYVSNKVEYYKKINYRYSDSIKRRAERAAKKEKE